MDTHTEGTEQRELIENQNEQNGMEVTHEATNIGSEEDIPFHGWEDVTLRRRSARIMNRLLKGEEDALIGIFFIIFFFISVYTQTFCVPSKDKA